jgi:hypothetical protein
VWPPRLLDASNPGVWGVSTFWQDHGSSCGGDVGSGDVGSGGVGSGGVESGGVESGGVRTTWHPFDVALAINLVHISPWVTTVGLLKGSSSIVRPGGVLLVYGPFLMKGKATTPSNAEFDISLRRRNVEWGLRDVGALEAEGGKHGWRLVRPEPMPSNNFILIFQREEKEGGEEGGAEGGR